MEVLSPGNNLITLLTVIAQEAIRTDAIYVPISGVSLARSTVQTWSCFTRIRDS